MATTEELNTIRLQYLEDTVLRGIRPYFATHHQIQSACVLVAQYWNDEAADAVHASVVFSQLPMPDLDAHFTAGEWDPVTDTYGTDDTNGQFGIDGFELYMATRWDSNGEAIPLFQAFCVDGSQEDSDMSNYRPYCVIRRSQAHHGVLEVVVVGQLLRPHLDGLKPEEEQW
jgi:hypothetical protein